MNEDNERRIEPTLDPNMDVMASAADTARAGQEAARQQAELAAARGEVEALRRRHGELLEQLRRAQAEAQAAQQELKAAAAQPQPAAPAPAPAPAVAAAANDDISAEEAQAASAADRAQLESTMQELEASQARAAELQEQFLRAQAEVQNVRRRAEEEASKARKFAIESFAESLLAVADSLEAGLAIQEATPQQIREGAEATLRQLKTALERNKVIEIAPAPGSKFDPHQHQAISMVPAPEGSQQEPNTIVSVLQKGYLIAERVLRPALVTVAAPR